MAKRAGAHSTKNARRISRATCVSAAMRGRSYRKRTRNASTMCIAAESFKPLRLGLFMMPLHPSYRAIADCYDRDIDQLVLADKLGFDEAWLGEHFTEKWENAPSPDLLIA